jgi:hypothetical protein
VADDRLKRGPADRLKVSLSDGYEVEFWTARLGVSREHLREAVKAVGNSLERVREYLGR